MGIAFDLSHELAVEVASCLRGSYTMGTNLFAGRLPQEPSNSMCIMQSGGAQSDRVSHDGDSRLIRHDIEILCRNTQNIALRDINLAIDCILGLEGEDAGGLPIHVVSVTISGAPARLFTDDQGRDVFSATLSVSAYSMRTIEDES